MLTPLVISSIIEDAVASLTGFIFLRATDAEANVAIDDIDLSGSDIAIYNNRPTTSSIITETGGSVTTTWPVEISFLGMAELDDNDENADTVADPLYSAAIELFQSIQSDSRVSLLEVTSGYEIDLGTPVKLYDKILTGVILRFDIMDSNGLKC